MMTLLNVQNAHNNPYGMEIAIFFWELEPENFRFDNKAIVLRNDLSLRPCVTKLLNHTN